MAGMIFPSFFQKEGLMDNFIWEVEENILEGARMFLFAVVAPFFFGGIFLGSICILVLSIFDQKKEVYHGQENCDPC